jgi:hypothetical protein
MPAMYRWKARSSIMSANVISARIRRYTVLLELFIGKVKGICIERLVLFI